MSTGRDWRDDALCSRMLSTEEADRVFFGRDRGTGGQILSEDEIATARAICDRCPVWEQCLTAALRVSPVFDRAGIFAGLLPDERASLRSGTTPTLGRDVLLGGDPDGHRASRTHREPVGRVVA